MSSLIRNTVFAFIILSLVVITGCDEIKIDGSITASPETIEKGDTSTLTWDLGENSDKADSAVIEPGIGAVSVGGVTDVKPLETTTYTITWTGEEGTATDSVTITVIDPPTATLDADNKIIQNGDSATLIWTCENATSCSIEPGIGNVELNDSIQVEPSETTTYTITATGLLSSTTAEVTISVYELPEVTFSTDKSTIQKGDSATLTWVSKNAASCTIEPGIGNVELSDFIIVSPIETTTYTITVSDTLNTDTKELTITVVEPPIVNFTVENPTITIGESTSLTWTSENATTCSIEPGIGIVELNDSMSVTPSETTTYTITVTGPLSTTTAEVTVNVEWPEPEVSFSATPQQIISPNPTTLSWSTANATSVSIDNGVGIVDLNDSIEVTPSETTTYTITVSNPDKNITAQQEVTVKYNPPQVTTFSVSNSEINHGDSVTLSWNVRNADSVYINNGIGKVTSTDSREIYPDYTTTWTMSAYSKGGTLNADVSVKVLDNPPAQLTEGSYGEKYQDLVPADASLESYDEKRFIIVTGLVNDINGNPLSGVNVNIFNHPEYGSALTDSDGQYSIPSEGGGIIKLVYTKDGYLTSHRQKETPWNDIVIFDDIALITIDPVSTEVVFDGNPETIITHKSTEIIDTEFGNRSCTMVFSGDNMAYEVDKYGNRIRSLPTITTRATEYTTPESMPSVLPPNSAFTHCAELGVDGVERVQFDKPVILYIDNFLNFPSGGIVPVGYYDRDKGQWIASENGVVVELLDTDSDGVVDALDSDGDGNPNDLDNDGDFIDEITGLEDSAVYTPGTTYWRVAVKHFTPWDHNWPYGPPEDAIRPNPKTPPETDSGDPACFEKGTLVHTAKGLIPIEEISIGDRVWSFDENTEANVLDEVSRVYATPNQKILKLKFENEEGDPEIFRATSEHPFMVVSRGWTPAAELKPGDIISSINDKVMIFKRLKNITRLQTVYNLEVKNQHSYFVGENGLLVHNAVTSQKICGK